MLILIPEEIKGCEDSVPALSPFLRNIEDGCSTVDALVIKASFCICDSFLCNVAATSANVAGVNGLLALAAAVVLARVIG